ncbi:hypothetical protein LDG_5276 [Legionella drancourtii LLAP12]|uniref:Uncharacterized protein n=1 Tax=Legionella drancourtii LLAP12 TaxID=658187 RepID=G9EJB7_9GAMM|nr:hypothetical protein LDG_5276 [Legionella drancourtii LLAP12]
MTCVHFNSDFAYEAIVGTNLNSFLLSHNAPNYACYTSPEKYIHYLSNMLNFGI